VKQIKAIIRPIMLPRVIHAVKELEGLPGITVSEVKGFGKSRAESAEDSVVEDSIGYAKKIKLELVVPDSLAEVVVNVISEKAHTGRVGDGKIFVTTVDDVVKIRTGERGLGAI